MILQIIAVCIFVIMILHGFFSTVVLYEIRPTGMSLYDVMFRSDYKKGQPYFFQFRDLTAVSLWGLLAVSNLILIIADTLTSDTWWPMALHVFLAVWSFVALLYWIDRTSKDYPDKDALKNDLKRYFTYKDHWCYLNCEDLF